MPSPPTNHPLDSTLPFRLQQSTFRLYEPTIALAVKVWPEKVSINPAPLRATTVTARLRDALLSLYRFRWLTEIDMEIFDQLYPAISVIHGDNTVQIGPRQRLSKTAKQGFKTQLTQARLTGIQFDEGKWTTDDINAICRLLSSRLLAGPVFIRPPLTDAYTGSLEHIFDIACVTDEEKTTII